MKAYMKDNKTCSTSCGKTEIREFKTDLKTDNTNMLTYNTILQTQDQDELNFTLKLNL